jgi:hypothetical protein
MFGKMSGMALTSGGDSTLEFTIFAIKRIKTNPKPVATVTLGAQRW